MYYEYNAYAYVTIVTPQIKEIESIHITCITRSTV